MSMEDSVGNAGDGEVEREIEGCEAAYDLQSAEHIWYYRDQSA